MPQPMRSCCCAYYFQEGQFGCCNKGHSASFCQEVSKSGRSAHITINSGGSDCANETASGLTGSASVRISYMQY